MIKVGKKWEKDAINIGRPSIFGNPYYLKDVKSLSARTIVITKYEEYFYERLKNDPVFKKAVDDLPDNCILGCYCSPLPCHGDIIKEYLDTSKQ